MRDMSILLPVRFLMSSIASCNWESAPSARKSILTKTCIVDAVFIPLADISAVDGAPDDWNDIDQRSGRDDHAAGMLPHVLGKPSSSEDKRIKSRHTGALIFS